MKAKLQALMDAIAGTNINSEKILKAYEYADKMHEGQKRASGEPYIIHPLSVALICAELNMDTDSICAALLHDVIEDCPDKTSYAEIVKEFGEGVAMIVDGVTKLVNITFEDKQEENVENLRKMFFAMSKDVRVIFVKLADRVHNMRTLSHKREERQRAIALETMHVYAPIAHRLGIHKIKQELEDLALRYLDPIGYKEIQQAVEKKFGENKDFLEIAKLKVAEKLSKYNLKFSIVGRVKTIYSVYRKIYNQHKEFDEIYDFYALRVLVDTELDCYTALGIVHEEFNFMPGRFKDYISTPKPNLYRSIHTTVIGHSGVPFEVQFRTWDMHQTAEYGLAAHWKYKSGEGSEQSFDEKLQWIRTLLDTVSEEDDPDEFFRPLKVDFFEDEIFVFTPKGDVVDLPAGSTLIDFAYHIHSAVGNRMVGGKINGKIAPIDTVLETGSIVEIITSSTSKGPGRDWLKIVRTGEARSKIRQFFKKERRTENIAVGKAEVDKELKKYVKHLSEAQKDEIIRNICERVGVSEPEDLYNNIGYGGFSVSKISTKLKDEAERVTGKEDEKEEIRIPETVKPDKPSGNSGVVVDSVGNLEVKFARCCSPLPGDNIIGFVTRGHGVSIHKYDCPNVALGLENPSQKDRWLVATWAEKSIRGKTRFEAGLKVFMDRVPDAFKNVTMGISALNMDMTSFSMSEGTDVLTAEITVKCENLESLNIIMNGLKKIKGVISVKRGS
ncbi:MAG: bifunctional (p)ppGpp synthetase/guanosine-3',5'-bis(diphosphate) 3'-pyrophosphohydrolase [Ruminococcaceae bacterium]|nr:bifunctional (p)ppGpp synthetase/guanosine-3',5'-bis(diphosphate) 3'-pyrophosphohydrolase [Oscillospiraceae bacterium]